MHVCIHTYVHTHTHTHTDTHLVQAYKGLCAGFSIQTRLAPCLCLFLGTSPCTNGVITLTKCRLMRSRNTDSRSQ